MQSSQWTRMLFVLVVVSMIAGGAARLRPVYAAAPPGCMQQTVGSGSNVSYLIIDWNDGITPVTLAWSYQWSGTTPTIVDMMAAVAAADSRFSYTDAGGSFLLDARYDLDDDGTDEHFNLAGNGWWSIAESFSWCIDRSCWQLNEGIGTSITDDKMYLIEAAANPPALPSWPGDGPGEPGCVSSSTATATPTPTSTDTATAGTSFTATPTPTSTDTATAGPSSTATPTPTATGTATAGPSSTATPTPTSTDTATAGPSPTSTLMPTATDTATAGPSPTATSTSMPITQSVTIFLPWIQRTDSAPAMNPLTTTIPRVIFDHTITPLDIYLRHILDTEKARRR